MPKNRSGMRFRHSPDARRQISVSLTNPKFENASKVGPGPHEIRKGRKMTDSAAKKCQHLSCQCMVASDQKYCSQLCKDAGSDEIEIACDCGHPACEKQTHG
jgi:hypothetical protein